MHVYELVDFYSLIPTYVAETALNSLKRAKL